MTVSQLPGRIVEIDDPLDPRIEEYRDIRERDLVGRRGLFVAEGKVVLEKLLGSQDFGPTSLLIARHRIEALQDLLDRVPAAVPVYSAAQPVIDAVAGFPLHRGILAIGRKREEREPDDLLRRLGPTATVMLLSGIANHDNMGGLFRNAAAFGVDAVLLDSDCCDPLYRKAIRVSVGATLLVPFARVHVGSSALDLLQRNGFTTIALSPRGEVELAELQRNARMAAVFGAEGPGLQEEVLSGTLTVRLAMAGGFDSLNVATTSGIVLYHLSRP